MSISDFGGKLRQARERRGISLRQIAASTKISPAALDALERNDVSKLPGGIFSRAFVRSYAVEVGLPPDETVKEFLDCFQDEPPAPTATHVPLPEHETRFESQRRMASVVLRLVLISVPIAGAIVYFSMRHRESQRQGSGRNPPQSSAPATPPPPAGDAPQAGLASSAVSEPRPTTSPAPAGTAVAATMTIELHPTGPCRISMTVDGEKVLDRVMQRGEREARDVRNAVVIEVGDAGTFEFSIDGRPGKSLGDSGHKTARITRDTLAAYLR